LLKRRPTSPTLWARWRTAIWRVESRRTIVFGKLKDDANRMAEQLTETLSETKAVGCEVSTAALEISASTGDLSQRTEERASREQSSASMEEMSATVKKNPENALQANELTSGSGDIADRGGQVVAKAVDAMARIEESARKISHRGDRRDLPGGPTCWRSVPPSRRRVPAMRVAAFAVVASEVRSFA